jgi:hypothetical protein
VATPRFFIRLLALVRRASRAVYRALVVVLLALVYVIVIPPLSLFIRLRGERPRGFRRRDDPEVASLPRLRSRF